ncbi:MAG: ureidoglycolate lyase [Actinomycetes bacterium]
MTRLTLEPGRLTEQEWAPFGWLPVADTDPSDGTNTLHFAWGDPHLNVIAHAYDEIEHRPEGAVVARMYRHATHTQALMGLNVPSLLAVAAPDATFSDPSDLDRIRAFRLEPHEVLVLHRGTWHWGPFPLGTEPVRLLNVQGLRYAEDNDSVDIAAVGEVIVGG